MRGRVLRLFYFKSADGVPNFGDDLNPWLWQKLLGEFLSSDGETLFAGIGTLLNDRMPRAKRTIVFGSGVGFGSSLPHVDESWMFCCVRGPLSARALQLPPSAAVTDPALLVATQLPAQAGAPRYRFSYMPHFRNTNDHWARVCRWLGFGYIDPRDDVETVVDRIRTSRVVITEAMHGAIVADALGVPWIPVKSAGAGVLDFKWRDWCASVELPYQPEAIIPLYAASRGARLAAKSAIAAAELYRISRTSEPRLSDARLRRRHLDELCERLDNLKRHLRSEIRQPITTQ